MNIHKMLKGICETGTAAAVMTVIVLYPGSGSCEKFPHMEYPTKLLSLDTGYILGNGANVQVGLGETGFGLRDRVQVTTSTLLDIATMVNFQLKGALLLESERRPALSVLMGYQYKYVDGYSESNEPITLDSDGDSVVVDAGLNGHVHYRAFLGGVDFDPLDQVKLIHQAVRQDQFYLKGVVRLASTEIVAGRVRIDDVYFEAWLERDTSGLIPFLYMF